MQAPLLLLIAGACKSIDISCPSRAQQQTRRTPLSIDGTDRQTDGRTLGRYRDPAPHSSVDKGRRHRVGHFHQPASVL